MVESDTAFEGRGVRSADQALEVFFVAAEIAKRFNVLEGELEGFERVVETEQVDGAGYGLGCAQNGQRIGCRPQADVPNDELAGMVTHALEQAKLANVQGLGFGDRPDDRMKRFAMSQRM